MEGFVGGSGDYGPGCPASLHNDPSHRDARVEPGTAQRDDLFVDLRGYTGIAERLPSPAWRACSRSWCGALGLAIEQEQGQDLPWSPAIRSSRAGFGLRGASHEGATEALAREACDADGIHPIAKRWRDELKIDTGIGIGIHFRRSRAWPAGIPPGTRKRDARGDTVVMSLPGPATGRARAACCSPMRLPPPSMRAVPRLPVARLSCSCRDLSRAAQRPCSISGGGFGESRPAVGV